MICFYKRKNGGRQENYYYYYYRKISRYVEIYCIKDKILSNFYSLHVTDIDTIEKKNNYRSELNMFYREFCGFHSYMQHFDQIARATFRIIEANPDRRNSFYAILEFQS